MLAAGAGVVSEWSSVPVRGGAAVGRAALAAGEEAAARPSGEGRAATRAGGVFSPLLQRRRWRGEGLVVCHKDAPEKVSTRLSVKYHVSHSAS